MLRKLKREKLNKSKQSINLCNSNQRLIASTILIAYTSFIFQPIAFAQQIVTDGRTNTVIDVNGTISNVSTSTVHGVNAFNSFDRFNVYEGNTVNLIVPNSAANLINLINRETSHIDGILNSLKNGQIGGNVYLLNPQGVVFGKNSSVNVGSLNVYTPTKEQMDKYFDLNGNINDVEIGKLTNGEVALTETGLITVDGKINALKDVTLAAGNISINGDVLSGAAFQNTKINFSDVVNVNGYNVNNMSMVAENGEIVIKSVNNIEVSGKVVNDGSNNRNAGNIDIDAGNNITINENSIISAKGLGENSNGGNINILAQNDTTFKKNALIDVKGGILSGDAGFIELSAKKNVNLNGGIFEAFAANGKTGTILIDPENLYITANNFSNGANILLEADKLIDVADGIILSTRQLADLASDHETANSTGNSGSLTIKSPEIIVNNNAKLLSFANNGFTSGDINLTAEDTANTLVDRNANTNIEIHNAILNGGNINITATSDTSKFSDGSTLQDINNKGLLDYSGIAGVSLSDSNANIEIGGNSSINATGDVKINSKATSNADLTVIGYVAGLAYAESKATAEAIIKSGVQVNTSGNLELKAETDNSTNLKVGGIAGTSVGLTFAMGETDSTTNAKIETGATITAGSINVEAASTTTSNVSSASYAIGGGSANAGIAVSNVDTDTNAYLGGTATALTGDINVKANNTVEKNRTSGSASNFGKTTNISGKFLSAVSNLTSKLTGPYTGGGFNLSSGVAYAESNNTANAVISDNAVVKAEGNVNVNSKIQDNFRINAIGSATSDGTAISGAIQLGDYKNTANAYIGKEAEVNSKKKISVKSEVEVPDQIDYDFSSFSDIVNKINFNLGTADYLFTSYVQCSGSGSDAGMAGAIGFLKVNNDVNSYIDEGAVLNNLYTSAEQQVEVLSKDSIDSINLAGLFSVTFFGSEGKGSLGGTYNQIDFTTDTNSYIAAGADVNSNNDVTVKAESDNQILSITEAGGKAEKIGVAGAISNLTLNSTTKANIDSSANVEAQGNVSVNADDKSLIKNYSGGFMKGGNAGIGASVSLNDINTTSKAFIAGDVFAHDGIAIDASTSGEINAFSLAAAIATGSSDAKGSGKDNPQDGSKGKFGIGISGDVAMNDISADTLAYISNNADVSGGSVDGIKLTANNNTVIKSISGAVSFGSSAGLAGSYSQNDIAGETNAYIKDSTVDSDEDIELIAGTDGLIQSIAAGGSGATNSSGIAAAGSVTRNNINRTTSSYADDSVLSSVKDIKLNATDNNTIESLAGALSAGTSGGIGGAVAENNIGISSENSVKAYLNNTSVSSSQNVLLNADSTGIIKSLSASLGVGGTGGVAGSISLNSIKKITEAYINDSSSISATKKIELTADDTSAISSISGAAGFSGTVGIGAAFAKNDIDNKIYSYIEDSTLTSGDDINLSSTSNSTIESISAAGAGAGTASAAASVSLNETGNETKSYVKNSILTATDKIDLNASDPSTIKSLNASLSIGQYAGIGGGEVTNTIKNKVYSYLENSTINSDYVEISSSETGTIETGSVGLSGSLGAAASGSASLNTIDNEIKAYISGGTITTDQNVTILADDTATIKALAGNAAFGGVGIGVSVATNDITNTIESYISGATVNTTGLVDIQANSDQNLTVHTVAGAASAGLSAVASVSLNDLDNTTKAYINNSSNVTGTGGINVKTVSKTEDITVKTTGIGLSLGSAFGGTASTIDINNTTEAYVDSSTVNTASNKDIIVDAKSVENTDNIVKSGTASLFTSANAAYAESKSTSTTKAYLGSNVTVNQANVIKINADRQVDLYSEAKSGTLGQIAVGASIAKTTINGTAESYIGDNASIGQDTSKTVGSIDIAASSTITGNSKTKAGSAGILSGNGSDARTTVAPTIRAYIGDNALIDVDNSININATTKIKSIADALGGSFGGIAVGVSIAEAKANPTIETYIGDDADIEAKEVILSISHNSGISDMAKAYADTSAGALIGGNGSLTLASINSTINSYIGQDAQITTTDNVSLTVNSYNAAQSNSSGRAYGLIAGGYTKAETDITENNNVFIKANTVSGKSINAKNVNLTLKADKYADTSASAGSGGLASGTGSYSDFDVTSNNKIYAGDSTSSAKNNINADQNVVMDADSTLSYKTTNNNSAAGVIAAGIPEINNYIDLNTDIKTGNYNNITTGGSLTLDGYNRIANFGSGYSLIGGASGLASIGSGDSTTNADSTINAAIGSNSIFDIGENLNILLNADSIISESADLVAQGAITYADIDVSIDIDNVLTATFDSNSTIDTYNNVNTYLKSNTSATSNVLTECKGLAPIANGSAKSNVSSRNLIDIKGNSLIRPNKDAYFVTGKDIRGNTAYNKAIANARGDSAGLLWDFGSVNADADVGIDNDINIGLGTNLTAGEDINLLSNSGTTYSNGYSVSKSKFYLLFGIPITRYKHGGDSDTNTSNNVLINGAVQSGLYNNRKLTIALDGTVTEDGVNLDGTAEYSYNQEEALQVEIDAITADLVELNADLTVAQTEKATVQTTLTTKNTEKTNLETDKTTKTNTVTTKTGLITTNTNTVNTKIGLITAKNNTVDDNNQSILLKQTQINALDPEAANYATTKATLETEIATLQGENTTLNTEITTLNTEITTLNTEIATLESEVSTLNGEISDINANIITKNNEISEVQADLANKSQIVTNIGTDIENFEANIDDLEDAKADCAGGTTISALKVKPATIDSGYVNINGILSGTGSITAPGNDFSIEVLNRSTKNLVFDVLKINQNANGDINLNGSKLTSDYGSININAGTNKGKKIDIYNAFDPDDPSVDLSLLTYKDSSDILFSKDIENLGGDFTVRNMSGSVISQGLINAQNVFIYVPKGDYIHEFTKGRYMTGGTAGTSILYAGENIIISAQKIDVNGTIQSGTDYRSVVINNFNPLTDLTYNDVTEKTELIPVTTLGSNKDINGIKAVWDPDAERIKLYRADIRGGNIVLQGEILSSGNGKLKVVSGFGEINVVNNTNYDLEVYQLNTNQEINGKVLINNFKVSNADADSIINKTTTFKKYIETKGLQSNEISISRDDTKTIHVQNSVGTDITSPNVTISGENNATYTPNSDAVYYEPATGSYWYWKYISRSGWTEFWHGKRYDWTGVTYSYTATIAAKQPIGIEFLGKDQGLINITNNGTSDVYLKENIMNNSGNINISNVNGSIYNLGNSTIQSKNINLNAKNNIGSADIAIDTDLRDGYLDAVSSNSGLININETIGQMLVNKAITTGDLTLTSDGAIRQTGYVGSGISGHNVSLNSINADVGTISQDILVSTTGSLTVDAQSSVFITEDGDIKANSIKSEDGNVKLTATSIERDADSNEGEANISGKNITLNVTDNVGSLASDEQALFIDTTGDLDIQAGDDIHLNALNDININKIYSNTGNIKLISEGNINANVLVNLSDLDAENKTYVNIANIKANNLDIISTDGGIGTVNIDIDGIVNAQAQKSIILSNTNHVVPDAAKNDITQARTYVDDLRIGTIYSETGDVVLSSERSILDAKAGEDLNISGSNIALIANLGSIGTVTDDLNIKSTGVLTASSYDNIYLTSPDNINISSVDSSAKEENKYVMLENVVLNSGGNILDGSDFEYYNIESKNITLNAAKIGDESNYLDVNSDVVNATAPSGIYLEETDGDLNITANSASGNIMTTANDGAINASVVAGGFLRASAENNISITESTGDMLLDTIESTNGDIGLTSSISSITDNNSNTNNIIGKNVTLIAANSIDNDITASEDLNMTATNSNINADINVLGTVTSVSKDDTAIEALTGDINVNTINSQTGNITLKAANSILDSNLSGVLNLSGNDLTLTATNGQIDSDVISTGIITADAKNNININATSGDINANTINSQTGDITLTALNSILDSNLSGVLNISGKDLTLTATNGQIDSDVTSTGVVTANAKNNININATSGDINANLINSQTGDITLTSDNSILDANSDDSANITGKDLTLTATNGSIGSSSSDLRTISTNKINMTAQNDIYLTENNGDIVSDDIKANTGSIKLTTDNGNVKINNISASDEINIKANGDLIDIEIIDPKKIDLAVSNTDGSIDLNKAFVSEHVKMTADNIRGNFIDTTAIDPLTFYITANKDANAKNVFLDVSAGNFGIEKFASNYAQINSQNDVLNWQQVKIGDRLDLTTPGRTILLKNVLGHLDLTKDIEIYETGSFNLIADSYGVKTSAYVKYAAVDQRVNWDSQPIKISDSAVSSNNTNMSKSQEDTDKKLNPPDMKDQINNKRDSLRYTINTDGIIKIADGSNITIKVTDISSGGAGISVDKDIPIGEEMNFKLSFNGLEINVKSTVVSKEYDENTGTYKLGLKFIDIPEDVAQQIPYACMLSSAL